jgi:hypothetical protein
MSAGGGLSFTSRFSAGSVGSILSGSIFAAVSIRDICGGAFSLGPRAIGGGSNKNPSARMAAVGATLARTDARSGTKIGNGNRGLIGSVSTE